jgi:hypothetical protein
MTPEPGHGDEHEATQEDEQKFQRGTVSEGIEFPDRNRPAGDLDRSRRCSSRPKASIRIRSGQQTWTGSG